MARQDETEELEQNIFFKCKGLLGILLGIHGSLSLILTFYLCVIQLSSFDVQTCTNLLRNSKWLYVYPANCQR
jgi:hypothetical protein